MRQHRTLLLLPVGVLATLAAAAVYQIHFFLLIPADLLSFAESPFISDIIRIKAGLPLFSPPGDNNSYPYSPGTQLLTYALASIVGTTDSVPVFRHVQFSFVVGAAFVAAIGVAMLVRRLVPEAESSLSRFWFAIAFSLLLLVAVDPRFNLYTHSLHNDGLALLVSASAFLLVVRHSARGGTLVLCLMALVPAAGFMVKQSLVIWWPLLTLHLLVTDPRVWRRTLLFSAGSAAAIALSMLSCYLVWGGDYLWWVFGALGAKEVSVLRSALHLLGAGGYVIMCIVALGILTQHPRDRSVLSTWAIAAILMVVEAYTSGVAWVSNHLGPAVLLGSAVFLSSMARLWSMPAPGGALANVGARRVLIAFALVFLPGALGLVRVPANQVPRDLYRYIAAIEGAFEGLPASRVLLDNGSWVYLRDGVLMKDRSSPVALHVGLNQPAISHEHLECTIERIRAQAYDRILTHALYSAESHYDANFRGSGVRDAILTSYQEVGRIPAVEGVAEWWPRSLLLEISVMEPTDRRAGPVSDACR